MPFTIIACTHVTPGSYARCVPVPQSRCYKYRFITSMQGYLAPISHR